jgi:hypothetical protein
MPTQFDLLIQITARTVDEEAEAIVAFGEQLRLVGIGLPNLSGNSLRIELESDNALESLAKADELGDAHFEETGNVVSAAIVRHAYER